MMNLQGKKVLVFGSGKSGIGAADLLEQTGAKQAALYKVCIEDEIARETDGVQEERKADSNRQLLG